MASSPTGSPRSIDLILSDNIFGHGNSRKGLCTSFLSRFGLTKIALKTQNGRFGYPKDLTTPILMVSYSCGIEPMLSLL